MSQYIEAKKVLGVEELTEKTPAQKDIVKVLFEDGTAEVMPKLRFEMIVTEKISDPSAVQVRVNSHVSSVIYSTLHEYGVKMGEVEDILNGVSTITNNGYEKARDIKWGVEHRMLPLLEVNKVLVENHAKENNNGATSTGGGSSEENKG